jgi:hypothetical protein
LGFCRPERWIELAGTINTVIANAATFSTDDNIKGPDRHIHNELLDLKASSEKDLAAPYLLSSHVTTVPAHTDTITSGNFTMTLNFPKYGVAVTTGNIAFDDEQADIQTAVDTALSGESILSSYTAGDVDVALTGNLTANDATVTANGTSVNGAYMVVTTANVDLDADKLATPVVATVGTLNRAAEMTLNMLDILYPASSVPYLGETVTKSDFTVGGNPLSVSPATKRALVNEIIVNVDEDLGVAMREALAQPSEL